MSTSFAPSTLTKFEPASRTASHARAHARTAPEDRRRLRLVRHALSAIEWQGVLRVIPGIHVWSSHSSANMPRELEERFAVLVGTILEMRDAILDALERGLGPVLGQETVELWAEGRARECAGMAHIYDYNNRHNDGRVKSWVEDLISNANEDAFKAFWWTAPIGMTDDRRQLDLARLERASENVRALNEQLRLGPWKQKDQEKYIKISVMIDQVESYVAHPRAHEVEATLAHQFSIAFARFMVTHRNENKLPARREQDQRHRDQLEQYLKHQDELARLEELELF